MFEVDSNVEEIRFLGKIGTIESDAFCANSHIHLDLSASVGESSSLNLLSMFETTPFCKKFPCCLHELMQAP